jgi:glycosyltransferase involved in cell wall biosynthesis
MVCSILPHPPVSGGERRTLRLLEAMERAGAHPHLIVAGSGNQDDAAELRERGWSVDFCERPLSTIGSRVRQHIVRLPSPYIPAVESRLRLLSTEPTAFVQLEHGQNSYYHAAAGRLPVVLSTHNLDAEMLSSIAAGAPAFSAERWRLRFRARSMLRSERRAARRVDTVLCVSDHDADEFRRLGAKRVLVVPNGVDEELFGIGAAPRDKEIVLFFGLLSFAPNARGIARFVREAWPRLARQRPRAVLRVVGAEASTELRRILASADRVEFPGEVPNISVELAASRIVVVPIWEGGGTRLKVLESLAAGRPVVGTPLGVGRIGFASGRHGLIEQSPAGLAGAAAELLADPAKAGTLAAEGRSLAERYRWSDALRPAEELYRQWIADA